MAATAIKPAMEHITPLCQHHQLSDSQSQAVANFLMSSHAAQHTPDQMAAWIQFVHNLRQDREYLLHLAGCDTEMWQLEEDCTTDLGPVSEETALAVVRQAAVVSRLLPDYLVQKLFLWLPGKATSGLYSKYARLMYCFQQVSQLTQHNAENLLAELKSLVLCQTPQRQHMLPEVHTAVATAW